MNIKAILVWPLAFLMMLVSLALPPQTQADDSIAEVHVRLHAVSALTLCESKIDLARRNFWTYKYYGSPMQERNEDTCFEGFTFAGRLSKSKIAAFLAAAEENSFTAWEGEYEPSYFISGDAAWQITITFADGTTRSSSGRTPDGFPEGWNEMREAFKALTGGDYIF